jgi:hypothetical protein
MLEPYARQGGISEKNLHVSLDDIREEAHQGNRNVAITWATERLLANRVAEFRDVVRELSLHDGENPYDPGHDLSMSRWEAESALSGGNLQLGLNLFANYHALCNKFDGASTHLIHPQLFLSCGSNCERNEDWHNAIAAYQRANDKKRLLALAKRLRLNTRNINCQKYAALAEEAVASMSS